MKMEQRDMAAALCKTAGFGNDDSMEKKRGQATFCCMNSLKEMNRVDIMRMSAADIKERMNETHDFIYCDESGRIYCR